MPGPNRSVLAGVAVLLCLVLVLIGFVTLASWRSAR